MSFVNLNDILINQSVSTQDQLFELIVNHFYQTKVIKSKTLLDELRLREAEFSTNIGDGIAIPHCKSDLVLEPHMVVIRLKDPIDYQGNDKMKVNLVFSIVMPKDAHELHLKQLKHLALLLLNQEKKEVLKTSNDLNAIYQVLVSQGE